MNPGFSLRVYDKKGGEIPVPKRAELIVTPLAYSLHMMTSSVRSCSRLALRTARISRNLAECSKMRLYWKA